MKCPPFTQILVGIESMPANFDHIQRFIVMYFLMKALSCFAPQVTGSVFRNCNAAEEITVDLRWGHRGHKI